MSETELREALRAIVDPAMFDGNYVRSDWLPLWREAHEHARRLLDIPAQPEQDGEVAGLRAVAEAAQFLVGSIELGERPALVLNAASGVNRALAALDYPRDDEGLIDFARLAPARDDTSGGAS